MVERSAYVTGGTGSIGGAIVRALTGKGYKVTAQYDGDADGAEILNRDVGADVFRCHFTLETVGPEREFDIVVNSAGILLTKDRTEAVSISEWERTLFVNVTVPFLAIKKYLPAMKRKGWGRVVNIGSIYSLRGTSNNSAYNVSKHGLTGLTRSVAKECAPHKITCNEVCPTATESRMMQGIAAQKELAGIVGSEKYLDAVRAANPTGRMANPEDVASVCMFLVSDEAEYVNGVSIPVDGGEIC